MSAYYDDDGPHQRQRNGSYYARRQGDCYSDAYARQPAMRSSPRRSAAPPQQYAYRAHSRKPTWPPSPSVEDETPSVDWEGQPPVNTRGTVDQEKVLEDVEHPDDRRYVLVSDPGSTRYRRRKSFAERGNMAHINTAVEEPLVFPERVSTPYAYTKPQRESTAPARADFLSPEPMTPASANTPRTKPSRDSWDRHDVFGDSDTEPEDTTHLRTAERKPARYSFVKSDLQKEDLRTNLRDSQASRRDSGQGQRAPPPFRRHESSSSARDSPYAESPRSSASSLNSGGTRKPRPAPVETGDYASSRPSSRPTSPLQRAPSPKLPTRLRESPETSRPSSRGNPRPASPLAFSSTIRPPSPSRVPVTDSDWHATYPPTTFRDRSRPPSRVGRHETLPVTHPRIDVHSPSPARSSTTEGALPYPVDDRPLDVFMPSEAHYQFDHSTITSPHRAFPDSPRLSNSPTPASPRLRDDVYRPKDSDLMRQPKTMDKVDWEKPLPSCPRPTSSAKYDDWWSLKGYRNFNICPTCFDGVLAKTPFDVHFSQNRRGERPTERLCDFSSPWVRLAWLLTIKQRRPSLELLYELADIADSERPCPENYEIGSDRVAWYGIPDQRDGLHVANFAVCACDKKMIEALLPSMRGYFTRLPGTSYSSSLPEKYMCSLRTTSRRFPKYLDLLVELDTEAQDLSKLPNVTRFVHLARENAFKGECGRSKAYFRKPWHFIPSLPELTVCEECYDEIIWPALQSKSSPSTIPRLFNKAIQLVNIEDPEVGSSCCLYSPRMRKVFNTAVREADFTYLKRKALERKKIETRLAREKIGIMGWMGGLERGSGSWERAKGELRAVEREWQGWE